MKLIINQRDKYPTTANFLEAGLKNILEGPIKIITTPLMPRHARKENNEYYLHSEWTVKLDDDKIYIISDYICSVIDLTKELPTSILCGDGVV